MKQFSWRFIFSLLLLNAQNVWAQNTIAESKQRIAIFAPLYLDSAFDGSGNYKFPDAAPKYINNPGLEFYEGVQLALDSLANEKASLEVYVYDTRAAGKNLKQQLAQAKSDSVQLLIGYTSTVSELQQMAFSSQEMKIPFINVNLPNDGGVYDNPYLVLLNSTLKTHVEAIYRYIQKHFPLDELIVFRKKGQLEDLIHSYLEEAGKNTLGVPLKLKYVELTDSFAVKQITENIDSNRHSVCIAGSLEENFGKRLALQLASVSNQYPITLMGMPTFDNLNLEFTKPEFKGLEIIYSTPFYNPRTDTVSKKIVNWFNIKMFARPSDMVMRGYEATWRFANLLLRYKKDIASNISRKEFNVIRELDIQPVLNKKTNSLDYFENKKLFFIKMQNGLIKGVD
ncbi:MAG: amino acid ABC transporter substrate-binding protein [Bacteroidetes bacterium]|nr:amino acid ABC transporter substrate-binding protein [Bacteroidota bacterium]MBS1931491.1 amino acid ABC transporter substrate-binding protein [Bacteroidota bacterium]